MRKICKTMRVAVGYALAALTMIAFVLWSAVLVLAPFALLRVIVGGAGVTKAERIRNAWMEYQRAMNELQVTQEMGIYAPGLVEKVIQKKKEWLEAQGKE